MIEVKNSLNGEHIRKKWASYPSYKESGVEWLGNVPEQWKISKLKYIAFINNSVLSENTSPDYLLKYVDISGLDSNGNIIDEQEYVFEKTPSRARRLVKSGDTIVSTVRTYLRAIGFIPNPPNNLVVSTGFAVLTPRDGIYPNYLVRLIQSNQFIDAIVTHSQGVSYPAINPSTLAGLSVWVPFLNEQKYIVSFLDSQTTKIDALIAKKERLIELLLEKRTAIIYRTITNGLNPNAPMNDSGIDWIGKAPIHWKTAPVYARYEVQLGKMLSQEAMKGINPAPYLRNTNIQWDFVDITDIAEMDFNLSERQKFELNSGDLLICEGGEVGRTAIWRGELKECYFQKAVHRVRPLNKNDLGRFLYYVMYAAAKRGVFVAEGNKSTIVHLTAEKLRKHRFAFPPLSEQEAIVKYLDIKVQNIDKLINKILLSIENYREYRADLISAAVTGKIDVRGEA